VTTAPASRPADTAAEVANLVARVAADMRARGWMLATAESCTGGLIAGACTDLAGSSHWFEGGIVSYGNAAKTRLLGVPAALIERHGAVSEPVARAMAEGARARLGVDLAVAVTGIAGPGGGSTDKPVGTVWLAWAGPLGVQTRREHLAGDRAGVRLATVACALRGVLEYLRAERGG